MNTLKRLAARLPHRWQAELKRLHFGRQIARNRFDTSEAEFGMLPGLLRPGDWVIDVGANVGQYSKRFSDLVGATGRVLAFEPVPATFALLAANAERFAHANVSLFNAAVSDKLDLVGMMIPRFATGLTNYYEAHLVPGAAAGMQVLTLSLDALCITRPVRLVKIDAEGHEAFVLGGMQHLIRSSRPLLIIETGSVAIIEGLKQQGYQTERAPGSSNVLCCPVELAHTVLSTIQLKSVN